MTQSNQGYPRQTNIAVLIDGDNAQPKLLEKVLLEVARFGRPAIRRIYGDWTTPNMNGWKSYLQEHAITPVQQFRNSVGKNATDSALIIDAMDILYSQTVRCFCIVSSDSDYARLATRIREDGILFIGIGKQTTPKAFVKACDTFIYVENLTEEGSIFDVAANALGSPSAPAKTKATSQPTAPTSIVTNVATPTKKIKPPTIAKKSKGAPPIKMLQKAFAMSVQDDGWAHLGSMGEKLRQIDPAFDPRTWGYSQLSQLIGAASTHFSLKVQTNPGAGGQYVKLKPATVRKKPTHAGTRGKPET